MSDIIEAAARAMCNRHFPGKWDVNSDASHNWYRDLARSSLTAVTPLIRAQVLEEAIKVTEKHFVGIFTGWVGHAPITLEEAETIANECSLLCAADIRRLKGKP